MSPSVRASPVYAPQSCPGTSHFPNLLGVVPKSSYRHPPKDVLLPQVSIPQLCLQVTVPPTVLYKTITALFMCCAP